MKAFIVCGRPATGKSTYGAKLAKTQQAALIDIDTCTEPLVQIAMQNAGYDPNDRDSPYFKETFREAIYDTLFDIARENLRSINVVVVGPFTNEIRQTDWPQKLKGTLNAEVEIHYIECKMLETKKRMQERNNPRDFSKLKDWEKYVKYFEGKSRPEFEHIYVDTSMFSKV